jgi:hypothetical protein
VLDPRWADVAIPALGPHVRSSKITGSSSVLVVAS